ncbi:MAG TPA: hypothetical protein VFE62_18770 [Gemmataceae bacterium]|nr:hypothetical protein [Gemmataceae bacterium]
MWFFSGSFPAKSAVDSDFYVMNPDSIGKIEKLRRFSGPGTISAMGTAIPGLTLCGFELVAIS